MPVEQPKSDEKITMHLFVGAQEFMGQVQTSEYYNKDAEFVTVTRPAKVLYGASQSMLILSMRGPKEHHGHLTLRRERIDGHLIIKETGGVYKVWQEVTSSIVLPKKKEKRIRLVGPGGSKLN